MSKGRILVVDDEIYIVHILGFSLGMEGYEVITALDGEQALEKLKTEKPDLIVLDIMMPKLDGYEVCKSIKSNAATQHIPVILLSAKGRNVDQKLGFDVGADDYITKPFSPKEVVARVRAVLRRFDQPLTKEIVRIGDIVIDTAAMRMTVRNEQAVTTATEFRLIEFLASHPGRVYTRKSLLDAVWHDTAFVTPRIVDVYIRRLREKIERDPEKPRHIHTVRGAGYMFEVRK